MIKWISGTATSHYHFDTVYLLSHAALNGALAFALAAALFLLVERQA